MKKEYKAGKEVLAHCLRCKLDLAHTIIAMVGDEIAKVKCNTCGSGPKNFRPAKGSAQSEYSEKKPAKKVAASRVSKSSTGKSHATSVPMQADLELWREKNRLYDSSKLRVPPKNYSAKDNYQLNDTIQHVQFGLGFVVKTVNNKRFEILFEEGRKLLVMNHEV